MPSKPQTNIIGVPWSLSSIWNEILDNQVDRPLVPRNYSYASELGGAYCDRYLRMNAVPFTNPPNKRSKRKFVAGDMWEWVIGLVFVSAGIFQKRQIKVDTQLKGCIPVHGRLDYIVGGQFDYDAAMKMVTTIVDALSLLEIDTPPLFAASAKKFIEKYKGQILEEVIYESKSVSSFMMEKVQKVGPMIHHVLQNYHYVKGNEQGLLKGKLGYVCKDDCILEEFDIVDSPEIKKMYVTDIKNMTAYYNAGFDKKNPKKFMPPLEQEVLFEEGVWRFTTNFKIQYSNYLTYLYGYETPQHYAQWKWTPKAASWNNAFKRFVQDGEEIEYMSKGETKTKIVKVTDNNREKRAEALKYFPNWDKLVAKAKKAGAFKKDEEGDEA